MSDEDTARVKECADDAPKLQAGTTKSENTAPHSSAANPCFPRRRKAAALLWTSEAAATAATGWGCRHMTGEQSYVGVFSACPNCARRFLC